MNEEANSNDRACFDSSSLQKYLYVDESLTPEEIQLIEGHVEQCSSCEQRMAQLSAQLSGLLHNCNNNQKHCATSCQDDCEAQPVIAGYDCLELIDTGGFGVVWKMRDQTFKRLVAVKVMKIRDAGNLETTRRFYAEAQICSQLPHPYIVSVYEMGKLNDGRGFYVMRLVVGRRLDRFFEQTELTATHSDASIDPTSRPRVDLQPRLLTFLKVCEAIAFAHSQQVIHRDLKPQNVMVGEHGDIQVMDWGTAKVLRGTILDQSQRLPNTVIETDRLDSDRTCGGGLGTLAYMPPEQARNANDSDFRSDVFSLGAILYELLIGRPPYINDDPRALRDSVMQGDLTEAKQRLLECNADQRIKKLALDCLQSNPDDRPNDAGKVAQRVSELMSEFQQELETERLENSQRKLQLLSNRKQKRLWATIGLLLISGLGLTAWAALRINVSRGEAIRAKQSAEALAIQNRQLAENKTQVLQFLTKNFFGSADPSNEANRKISFREVLDKATDAARVLDWKPELKVEILIELGRVYFNLGEYDLGYLLFSEASQIAEQELDPRSPIAMTALDQLAMVLIRMERFSDAEPILQRAITLTNDVLGPEHEDSIHTYAKLGDLYERSGQADKAIAITEEVLAMRRRLWGDEYPFVLVSMNGLSLAYTKVGRFDEAVGLLRDAVKISQSTHGPKHPSTLTFINNLALALLDTGELEEARRLAEQSLILRCELLDAEHSDVFASRNTVANVKYEQCEYGPCLDDCQSMIHDFPEPTIRHGAVLILKGKCLHQLGRNEEATLALTQGDAILTDRLGPENMHSTKARELVAKIERQLRGTDDN